MKWLCILMIGSTLAGCGDDAGSSAAAGGGVDGSGGATGTGGAAGEGGDRAAGGDTPASTAVTSAGSGGEGGQGGAAPVEVADWLFELDGAVLPEPETIVTERISALGATDCFEQVELVATLPEDPEAGYRKVRVFACLDALVIGAPMPLAASTGETYSVQYTHDFDGGISFPSAEGTLTVFEDVDATGRFVAIAEGTVAVAISAGEDEIVPIHIELDQAVEL